MAIPSTFAPLLTRIREIAENAIVVDGRSFPSIFEFGYGTLRNAGNEDAIARGTLWKPEIAVDITRIENRNRLNANAQHTIYDITVRIEVAYNTDATLMKEKREAIAVQVANDTHRIFGALRNPTALEQTSAGVETGLSSGMLDVQGSNTQWDFTRALVKNTITAVGIISLSHV